MHECQARPVTPGPAEARLTAGDRVPRITSGEPSGEFPPRAGHPAEDDFDLDADFARWLADVEAGRRRIPDERDLGGPAITVSLGDAADLDPELLAAMCGPDGLGGEALSAAFGQDRAADVLRPGPVLAALTEQVVSDLGSLTDNQLVGALSAARRLENRAAYLQTVAIAEFARRREVERESAKSRKVPLHCRPGQFPGEELAAELVSSAHHADERIWQATDLVTRLPRTLAGMADGTIDATRAYIIWSYTWSLTAPDAARADEVLAGAAPCLRPDQLGRKAAALELKLDPAAVRRRREHARRDGQRVEVRHERSGNATLAGRELDPVTALAAKANIDALAARLRDAHGAGSLQRLRAFVMTELLQGRDPLDQQSPTQKDSGNQCSGDQRTGGQFPDRPGSQAAEPPVTSTDPASGTRLPDDVPTDGTEGAERDDWQDDHGYRDEDESEAESGNEDRDWGLDLEDRPGNRDCVPSPNRRDVRSDGGRPAPPGALPALVNILVPAGTLLGWSATPAQVGNWGLLDADEARAFTEAASRSPRTRFCVTLIAPDGAALAHGCARGQHPWVPPPTTASAAEARGNPPPETAAETAPLNLAQARHLTDLIRGLNVTLRPITQAGCDHEDAEDRYTPSRQLRHLVQARTATCTAPACDAQAVYCDLDHTVPYPDGLTEQCNLNPRCKR